jgi:SpoVK/Ycf46/Vps4 family AAA+-type ATPase
MPRCSVPVARDSSALQFRVSLSPPRCGKSLTATALAGELGLPLFLVRFDAVIGVYVGETAIHLRQILHFSESTACVLLFDELDAVGKRRVIHRMLGSLTGLSSPSCRNLSIPIRRALSSGRRISQSLSTTRFGVGSTSHWNVRPNQKALMAFARLVATERDVPLADAVWAKVAKAQNFADADIIVLGEARKKTFRDKTLNRSRFLCLGRRTNGRHGRRARRPSTYGIERPMFLPQGQR